MTAEPRYQLTVRDVFLVVTLTMFLFLGFEALIGSDPGKPELLALELFVGVPVLIYVLVRKLPLRAVLRLNPVSWKAVSAALCIGIGMKPVFDEINHLIQSIIPMPPEISAAIEQMMTYNTPAEAWILFIAVVPVAGLAEEMLYRGFVQSILEKAGDVTKAVLVTSLIFTIMHFNPWWIIEILIIGIFLGVLSWRGNSILPPAAAHGLYNGLGLLMANTELTRLKWYLTGEHVSPVWVVLGAGMIYGGFRWYYRLTAE